MVSLKKALLRAYYPLVSLKKALFIPLWRPLFLGGGASSGGGQDDYSHDIATCPSRKKLRARHPEDAEMKAMMGWELFARLYSLLGNGPFFLRKHAWIFVEVATYTKSSTRIGQYKHIELNGVYMCFQKEEKISELNFGHMLTRPTWRITPFSKWLITMVSKSTKDRVSLVTNGF